MTMQQSQRRLIVVLGMHRSGTSVIARSLMALGADLGENLLPPVAGNNDKGFWEDREMVALSDAVLERLGLAWDATGVIDRNRLTGTEFSDLRLRALEFIRSRLEARPVVAVKDPRLTRLLPFWAGVFSHLDARVDFVLCLRNPISTAQSLQRRDGFVAIKSHLLWLLHVTAMVLDTANDGHDARAPIAGRTVVSFERLLADPLPELARLARLLELSFDPSSDEVSDYMSEFLDRSLEHARYAEADLSLDPALPAAVAEIYSALSRAAHAPDGGLDSEIESICRRHDEEVARLAPLLQFASQSDRMARRLAETSSQRERELQATKDLLADRQARVVALSKLLDLLENKLPDGFGRHLALLAGDVVQRSGQPVLDGLVDARESINAELAACEARLLVGLRESGEGLRRELAELGTQSGASSLAMQAWLDRFETCVGEGEQRLHDRIEALVHDGASARREVKGLLGAAQVWQRDLKERSQEIGKLTQLLLEAQSACHAMEQARDESDRQWETTRNDLRIAKQVGEATRKRLDIVERSLSWRLAAPLRWPGTIAAWLSPAEWRNRRHARVIAQSGLFDVDWYCRSYPDVAAAGMSPILHYLKHGASELRDPGTGFSTRGYLLANPDVAESGMNPLLHYLLHGQSEGRAAGRPSP